MESKTLLRRAKLNHESKNESIMNTNNACVVSKRSVEKVYKTSRSELLRHFVKKFQKRSPLINRGYFLRMKIVEGVVRKFLQKTSGHGKRFIVNLGCGSDTLPLKFLEQEKDITKDAHFIDIDYPALVSVKCNIILENPNLRSIISAQEQVAQSDRGIILSTASYTAIGCDLEDVKTLDTVLREQLSIENHEVIFVAEVALTYMEPKISNSVIEWAAKFKKGQFCFLEQHLPDGPAHPFADTMMKHFTKLQSPLKSLLQYPLLSDQRQRFVQAGWKNVSAWPLWQLWSDDDAGFLTQKERLALNEVEPFDEWEEFAMFCSHYFLLTASSVESDINNDKLGEMKRDSTKVTEDSTIDTFSLAYSRHPKGEGLRRHGTSFTLEIDAVFFHGGQGSQGRVSDYFIVAPENVEDAELPAKAGGPQALERVAYDLMCHTITNISEQEVLLVGGRASPEDPYSACFLRQQGRFIKEANLPRGLYRHSAVAVDDQTTPERKHVLLFGGRSSRGKTSNDWLLWTKEKGWVQLSVSGQNPLERFGASMVAIDGTKGYLMGGMTADGVVLQDFWTWELSFNSDEIVVMCEDTTTSLGTGNIPLDQIGRFGARLLTTNHGLILIGGVTRDGILQRKHEMLRINSDLNVSKISFITPGSRPMLIGFGAENVDGSKIVITGGGAVCFSFGTFWNDGCYTLHLHNSDRVAWSFKKLQEEPLSKRQSNDRSDIEQLGRAHSRPDMSEVPRRTIRTSHDFEQALNENKPLILEGLDIGLCVQEWDVTYLKTKIGEDRQVVVHEAQDQRMDFVSKNFEYVSRSFGKFIDAAVAGKNTYLRSTSSTRPAEEPTNIVDDFPTIANDFQLPNALSYVVENMHSSPLRISGSAVMWLHYDVMANVLCQIRGEKRVTIFPPDDVLKLNFAPGSSSSKMDPMEALSLRNVEPHNAILKAGDVLLLPALWPHSAVPTDGFSIAVNVFFRSFSKGYSPGKDVYGNRDLQAYENGRKDLQRTVKAFNGVAPEARRFYLQRLAAELAEMV